MTATTFRKSSGWTNPAELRKLLKQNLKLNARQVSVRKSSSNRYLVITIRNEGVNADAVRQFAASFNTWQMSMDDSVSGQSIHVEISQEVRDAIAARHTPAAIAAAHNLPEDRSGNEIAPGIILWNLNGRLHLSRKRDDRRSLEVWAQDVALCRDYAIKALALAIAYVSE